MGNAFKSGACDVLLTSKARLDKAAGRTRRPSPSITSQDVCAMERVAIKPSLKVRGLCAPSPAHLGMLVCLTIGTSESWKLGLFSVTF